MSAVVEQQLPWSCGAASLVNAAAALGLKVTEATVRELVGTDPSGTSEGQIVHAARRLGLRPRIIQGREPGIALDELADGLAVGPAILCVDNGSTGWSRRGSSPAGSRCWTPPTGPRRSSHLASCWSAGGAETRRSRTTRSGCRGSAMDGEPRALDEVDLLVYDEPDQAPSERPRTRGECSAGGALHRRPCPWVSCRWHLAIDHAGEGRIDALGITIRGNASDAEVEALTSEVAERLAVMGDSCALDVADREPDGVTLDVAGAVLDVTRERVRQMQARSLSELRLGRRGRSLRVLR